MQRVIDIPGYGEIEFPDTMSDDEINVAAKRLYEEKNGPLTDMRTPGQVASDQAWNVLKGIPQAITSIPGAIVGGVQSALSADPTAFLKYGKSAIESMVQPFTTSARGAAALAAPDKVQAPSREEWEQAAQGAGANLGGLALGEAVQRGPALLKAALPSAEALQEAAAANKARALKPTTLQGRADAAAISEELSKRNLATGVRGATIDKGIMQGLDEAGQRVQAVENRLSNEARPEFQVPRSELLKEIQAAKSKLNIPRTNVSAQPEAINALNDAADVIKGLPEYIDADQMFALRRQFDQRADAAGSFGVNADTVKAKVNRGIANIARAKLNALDPELKIANHDYSVFRKGADIVERRQLGESGKIESSLPGRGTILDDILATWAGHAMGGTLGGAAAEAINLATKTRGWANLKSSLQQKLANMKAEAATPPRGLLGARPPLVSAPDVSFARASEATPGQPWWGDHLALKSAQVPKGLLESGKYPGGIVTPQPADTSYVTAVPARYGSPVPKMPPDWALSAVGKAINGPGRTVEDLAKARMAQIMETQRLGATEMVGKVKGKPGALDNYTGDKTSTYASGFKEPTNQNPLGRPMFPELQGFSESPSKIAAAIERGKGALYERIRKAVLDAMRDIPVSQSETSFDFGANATPRARQLEALRSLVR